MDRIIFRSSQVILGLLVLMGVVEILTTVQALSGIRYVTEFRVRDADGRPLKGARIRAFNGAPFYGPREAGLPFDALFDSLTAWDDVVTNPAGAASFSQSVILGCVTGGIIEQMLRSPEPHPKTDIYYVVSFGNEGRVLFPEQGAWTSGLSLPRGASARLAFDDVRLDVSPADSEVASESAFRRAEG